jgi:hypothetical protein
MAKPITIQDVKIFLIQAASAATRFIIVKVITSEPGLYGLGCALHPTFSGGGGGS